jgi:hypothetical protein
MRKATTHFLATSLLVGVVAIPAAAADINFADLRLGAGLLSNHFSGSNSTTVSSGGTVISSSSSSDDGRNSDHNYRGQIQFVSGHLGDGGGFVWGLSAAVNHATWDNGSQDADVTTPNVGILLGYGYAFTPNWHFELTPFGGIGRAYYSVTDNGQSHTSKNWEKYLEFGAKIGTYFTLGAKDGLQIGIEVPYLVGSFEPDYSYTDNANNTRTVSDKRENRGFGVLVTIGGRF